MNNNVYILVIGIGFIVLILRAAPFVFLGNLQFSKRVTLFLKCVPFASISALVFPDLLTAVPNNQLASYVGAISAIVFSYFFKNYLYTVASSIGLVYLVIKFL